MPPLEEVAEPIEKPRLTNKGLPLGFQAFVVSIVSSDSDFSAEFAAAEL
jgi:hypothetical protein